MGDLASRSFYLPHARDVTPTGERRLQPDAHDFQAEFRWDGPLAEREHVGVVVLPRPTGGVEAPAQRAAHAAHLVGDDRLAVARAAQDNAPFALAARDGL